MSSKELYNNVFINIFDIREDELNSNFTFNKVEKWDSLIHLTLITELEDVFNIMFETEDILHFGGYENGMNILGKYGVKFED